MKTTKIFAVAAFAVLLAFGAAPLFAAANPGAGHPAPSNVVKNFYSALTVAMKQGDKLGYAGRYKNLAPAIKSSFNLPYMTKTAVGPAVWNKATPAQQQQLISAFSDFSIANYASRFVKYDGEKFEVVSEKPASGGGEIVQTKLTPGGEDKSVALDYLMQQDEKGEWRIVDVYLDGAISELATRRSEFVSIVQRDGIPALVNSLGEKSRSMGPS